MSQTLTPKTYLRSFLLFCCLLTILYTPFNWLDARYGFLGTYGLAFNPSQVAIIQYFALLVVLFNLSFPSSARMPVPYKAVLAFSLSLSILFSAEYVGSKFEIRQDSSGKIAKSDELLGWVGIPGSQRENWIDGRRVKIQLNSKGLRGPEPTLRAEFMFLGNSVTFAQHVAEKETFVSLLGGINAAFDGYNTMRERDFFLRDLSGYRPRNLVLIVTAGDVMTEAENLANIHETLSSGMMIQKTQNFLDRWLNYLRYSSSIYALLSRSPVLNQSRKDNRYLELVRKPIPAETWRQWTKAILDIKKGAPDSRLYIVLSPPRMAVRLSRQNILSCNLNNELSRFCREKQIPFLDLLPVLAGHDADLIFHDFTHYTADGHKLVADAIARFFKKIDSK
ncbi:MAG: SGNH/GDSL hydrolase family protein [Desulfobacteraceae bacterium]|nr:SGNH/GDSL hydrolase family protein [Desulfobacteraceae bacterium]